MPEDNREPDDKAARRRRNIILALVLGAVALAFYVYAFFLDLY